MILWNPETNLAAPQKIYWVIPKPLKKGGAPTSKFKEIFECEVI